MKHQKPLIRRTFLQERFMILIELQQSGHATFEELTELDELINRDPKLRDIILEEMEEEKHISASPPQKMIIHVQQIKPQSLLEKMQSFFRNLFLHYKPAAPLSL